MANNSLYQTCNRINDHKDKHADMDVEQRRVVESIVDESLKYKIKNEDAKAKDFEAQEAKLKKVADKAFRTANKPTPTY
jgi:hypothetical protein